MIDKYYTPEQQGELEQWRTELGEEGVHQAERDWAELIAAAEHERVAGTAPTDARMLELARRWRALMEQFSGGDPGIMNSLRTMYREEAPRPRHVAWSIPS